MNPNTVSFTRPEVQAAASQYWRGLLERLTPTVIRTVQYAGDGKETLFCYIAGTGHRLAYHREEDWIEYIP